MQNPLVKRIVAVVVGVLVAGLVVGVVEGLGHMAFPPPEGLDITDPEDQARIMLEIPLAAKISVVAAWFLGALAGAWSAIRIASEVIPGWIVGLVMVGLSAWTTQMFPHPLWMMVSAFVLPLIAVLVAKQLHKARLTA
ncbi:hypothetical protein [Pontixanthobacter aquaemixtae]|uniref:Uncharacterized protein n=1 Tax=Pontixanthobacter aquaemixtae TaxID=1958940 RepID=A0A844ZSG2_9SPHN|nr:hypothetical protein [Pontixanthobacter aquaemixtae]MXO90434.1 hypothetical protein [Pontixanthobacter aquaemixtae]